MPMQELSRDADCKNSTCPSVHIDTDDPDHVYVVGVPVPAGITLPIGDGEIALKVKRQVIADANIA